MFLISTALVAVEVRSNTKLVENYEYNKRVFYYNIINGLYNGLLASKQLKSHILKNTAMLLAKNIGGKVEDFGNAYVIENSDTLIVLGHGSNGTLQSSKFIPLEDLTVGKKVLILGYCTSASNHYHFSSGIKVYTFSSYVLLTTVIFKIITLLHLRSEPLLSQLSRLLMFDYCSLQVLYDFYISGHYSNNRLSFSSIIYHNTRSCSTFTYTPYATLLFLLNDPTIPVLDPGDGGGDGPTTDIIQYPEYTLVNWISYINHKVYSTIIPWADYSYIKEFTIAFVEMGAPIYARDYTENCVYHTPLWTVDWLHPDIYCSFSNYYHNRFNCTTFDEMNRKLIWVQYPQSEVEQLIEAYEQAKQDAEDAVSTTAIVLGILAAITGITNPVLGAIIGTLAAVIELASNTDPDSLITYVSKLIDILKSSTCENGDGWLVYTPDPYNLDDPNDLWVTSGKWYWHDPNLKEGEKWWLDLNSADIIEAPDQNT